MATVVFALAVPAHALPGSDVQLPIEVPEVQVPDLPLPAVPQPPVAPTVPSVPQVPQVETGGVPSPPASAPQLPGSSTPNGTNTRASAPSGAGVAATGVPGGAGPTGPASSSAGAGAAGTSDPTPRRKQGIQDTRFKTPAKLVRGLRGCIDEIPRLQSVVLVLRYGVGSIESRSRRGAARALGTSARRVAQLERRGVRSLARTSRSSGCEGSGVRRSTFADVFELVMTGLVRDAFGTAGGLFEPTHLASAGENQFAAAGSGTHDGVTDVRGVQQSGGGDGDGAGPGASALAAPFGDIESSSDSLLSLLLLVAVILSAVLLLRRISDALH